VQQVLTAIHVANFEGGQRNILRNRLPLPGSVPVQIIWGSEDRILPPQHAEGLAPEVQMHQLTGVGHMPHMERPTELSRLILAFLAS
jgi:pyruvate dehydrogenase E2 component (dihydrolipoamide acetyltransferase)